MSVNVHDRDLVTYDVPTPPIYLPTYLAMPSNLYLFLKPIDATLPPICTYIHTYVHTYLEVKKRRRERQNMDTYIPGRYFRWFYRFEQ